MSDICYLFGQGNCIFITEKSGKSRGKDQGKFREKLGKSQRIFKEMSMTTMRTCISYFGIDRLWSLDVGFNIQCNVNNVGTANIISCFFLSGMGKDHEIPLWSEQALPQSQLVCKATKRNSNHVVQSLTRRQDWMVRGVRSDELSRWMWYHQGWKMDRKQLD